MSATWSRTGWTSPTAATSSSPLSFWCLLWLQLGGGLTFAVAGVSINLSGLAIAAIVGILLNAILPGNDYEFDSADGADAPSSGNLQV